MNTKPFDKALYDENDLMAKKVSADFLIQKMKCVLKTPIEQQKEQYKKYDFTILWNKQEIKVETERKKVWTKSGEWQGWPTVDIPKRKQHSEAFAFIMLNNTCDTLLIINMKDVLGSKTSFKKTIYTDKEEFFNVPLNKCMFFKKENKDWKPIH